MTSTVDPNSKRQSPVSISMKWNPRGEEIPGQLNESKWQPHELSWEKYLMCFRLSPYLIWLTHQLARQAPAVPINPLLSVSHTHTRSLSLSLSSLTYNFLSWVPPINKSNHFVPRHPPVIFTGHQRGLVTVRVGPALHSRKKRRESQTNRYSGRIKFKHVVGRWDSVRCGRIWAVRSRARDSRCPVKKNRKCFLTCVFSVILA